MVNAEPLDKMVGNYPLSVELFDLARLLDTPEKYTELEVTPPRGMLLYGVPGTGKTLAASCFMEMLGWPVCVVSIARKNADICAEVQEAFRQAAEKAPAVVFLDDMDKYANGDTIYTNQESYITIQSCFDAVRDKRVFVVATANRLHLLPDSLLRPGRFDKLIRMEPPRGKAAVEIVSHYLKGKPQLSNVDPAVIARIMEGHSCAELEAVVNEAAMMSLSDGLQKVSMWHMVCACLHVAYHIRPGSIAMGRMDDPDDPGREMTRAAYHEAGHAVVGEVLDPGSVVLAAIHREVEKSTGLTLYTQPAPSGGAEAVLRAVKCLVAGRESLLMKFGLNDMSGGSDLRQALQLAEDLMNSGAMGLTLMTLPGGEATPYLVKQREEAAHELLARCSADARAVLTEHRTFLDEVARALLREGFLTSSSIQELRARAESEKGMRG